MVQFRLDRILFATGRVRVMWAALRQHVQLFQTWRFNTFSHSWYVNAHVPIYSTPLRKGITLNTSTVHTYIVSAYSTLSATKKFTSVVANLMYPLQHKIENHHHQEHMIWIIYNYTSVLNVVQLKYYTTEINKELLRMIRPSPVRKFFP